MHCCVRQNARSFIAPFFVITWGNKTKHHYKVLSASDMIFVTSVNSSTCCSMSMCPSIYSWFSHFSGGAWRETCSPEAKGHKVGFFKKMTSVIGILSRVLILSTRKWCLTFIRFTLCTGTFIRFYIVYRDSHRERCRKFVFAPDCRLKYTLFTMFLFLFIEIYSSYLPYSYSYLLNLNIPK